MGNCASEAKVFNTQHRRSPLKEGDAVPNVTIKARVRVKPGNDVDCFKWKDITTADLFKGKRCVVFSIPGGNGFKVGL